MPDPSQPTYDLVLAGGSVLDPASGTDGVFDVAVADGKIAAIGPDLEPAPAHRIPVPSIWDAGVLSQTRSNAVEST